MNSSSNPPWADLPQELLTTIANYLTSNPIDILTFRSICKSWYSSSPSPSPFNISRILPLSSPCPAYSFDHRFLYHNFGLPILSVSAVFALCPEKLLNMEQDTKCWLVFVDQLTPGKLMIRQPLTKYHYSIPLNFPSGLDVPNIHVDEIAKFYNLSFHPAVNKPPSMWSEYVQKVVVNSDESYAIALFHTGQIGSSKLTRSPFWEVSEWDPVYSSNYNNVNARMDDIVFHKGALLGVDRVGRVYDMNLRSGNMNRLIVCSISGCGTKRKRFVESNGMIYLVVRESVQHESDEKPLRFKVFELDGDVHEWVEVGSLDGMVLFFGLDFSFAMLPHKLGGSFRKNCIVFIENSFKDYDEGVADDAMLFSNLRFGDLRVGVWHMEDPYHCGTIESYPDYSNVLWPPPPWLWRVDMSKRIGDLEAALDDILVNAPAEKLKLKVTSKQKPPLEQAIAVGDDANEQEVSEIWRAAHTVLVYLNEAKEIHKRLKSIKSKKAVISRDMKLNAILLHLEETTTKLQKVKPKNISVVPQEFASQLEIMHLLIGSVNQGDEYVNNIPK